jgi:hypothetical protein
MTERIKKFSAADNRRIEERAIAEIKRIAPEHWKDMFSGWQRLLPALRETTQKRILVCVLDEAVKREAPLSAKLVKVLTPHLIRLLDVSPVARSGIHDLKGFRKVAAYLAKNPRASLNELAGKTRVKRDTIRIWKRSDELKRLVWERQLRLALKVSRDGLPGSLWELDQAEMKKIEVMELDARTLKKLRMLKPKLGRGKERFRIFRPVCPKKF